MNPRNGLKIYTLCLMLAALPYGGVLAQADCINVTKVADLNARGCCCSPKAQESTGRHDSDPCSEKGSNPCASEFCPLVFSKSFNVAPLNRAKLTDLEDFLYTAHNCCARPLFKTQSGPFPNSINNHGPGPPGVDLLLLTCVFLS
jgi:hypothetical protein